MRSQGRGLKQVALAISAAAIAATLVTGIGAGAAEPASVPTTTVAPTTTLAPTATVPAEAATTVPGPVPRPARRIATAVTTEKIRPTSLPFRALGVGVGAAIVCLAVGGFVYGKVRSRVPAVAVPRPAPAPVAAAPGPAAPGNPSEPAASASSLPPPVGPPRADTVSEWAPPKETSPG